MTTLPNMKIAIHRATDWCVQRGPDAYDGYFADSITRHQVAHAKTWSQLADCAPSSWQVRIADRSLIQD